MVGILNLILQYLSLGITAIVRMPHKSRDVPFNIV